MNKWEKLHLISGSFLFFIMLPLNGMGQYFIVNTPNQFQIALDTASLNNEADTIDVVADTYNLTSTLTYNLPSGSIENYSLEIIGAGAEHTILDGTGTMQVLSINTPWNSDANSNITIRGLTFQNGKSDYDGGLSINSKEADLTVENCRFINNQGSYGSGGLGVSTDADVTLRSNFFESNTTYDNGAGASVIAGYNSGGTARIENNIFQENHSLVGDDDYGGGGAYVFGDNLIITGNTFQGNKLDAYYTFGGAGLCAVAIVSADVSNNTFTNNVILSDSTDGPGGAYIGAYSSATTPITLTVTENQFSNNVGIHGGGARVDFETSLTFSKNIFENNSALTDAGGAHIESESNGTAKIVNNVFVNNEANGSYANAGGLYLETSSSTPSTMLLTNNTFTLNDVLGDGGEYNGKGGGIYLTTPHNDTSVSLYNNIVWGNSSVEQGDDIYIMDDSLFGGDGTGSIINLYNNDFNDLFYVDGDHLSQTNNIDSNPNFADAANNDIHLLGNSPCIEVGNDSAPDLPATDFEDDDRIINDHVDIGADEYDGVPVSDVLKGDVNDDKIVDLIDVILSLQLLTGLAVSTEIHVEADADADNKIGISDVIFMLEIISLPPPQG